MTSSHIWQKKMTDNRSHDNKYATMRTHGAARRGEEMVAAVRAERKKWVRGKGTHWGETGCGRLWGKIYSKS